MEVEKLSERQSFAVENSQPTKLALAAWRTQDEMQSRMRGLDRQQNDDRPGPVIARDPRSRAAPRC